MYCGPPFSKDENYPIRKRKDKTTYNFESIDNKIRRSHREDNHWELVQAGEDLYEEKQYGAALREFLKARALDPECPLVRWNLAGTYDMLGLLDKSVAIYVPLIGDSLKVTPDESSCWEGPVWTRSLRADCTYRLGIVFLKQGKDELGIYCLTQFMALLSLGIGSLYSEESVLSAIGSKITKFNRESVANKISLGLMSSLLE